MAYRKLTVVVPEDQAEMLGQLAAEQGESLSAYLRGRIFAKEKLEDEFQALQTTLLAAIGEGLKQRGGQVQALMPEAAKPSEIPMGLLLETLLLLRGLANPQKVQAVRAEVERLGHKTYG